MTQDDGGYQLKPAPSGPAGAASPDTTTGASSGETTAETAAAIKPGDPGWVPPVPIIEKEGVEYAGEAPPDPDVEHHRGLAILAYVFFLIPLVAAPNSKFARYHANQGLILFIILFLVVMAVVGLSFAGWLVDKFVTIGILHFFFSTGFGLLQFALLLAWVALMIIGIVHAANGEKKPLPGIGIWTLIK